MKPKQKHKRKKQSAASRRWWKAKWRKEEEQFFQDYFARLERKNREAIVKRFAELLAEKFRV